MPGLRLLLRIAPFLVGALAAAVWLRRRHLERPPLPAPPPVAALPAQPVPDSPLELVSEAPAAPMAEPPAEPGLRFARDPKPESDPEPISIVTVVDDLLQIGRQ